MIMDCSIFFLELTLYLDMESFNTQLDRAYKKEKAKSKNRIYKTDSGHTDESLISHGIVAMYCDDSKKKKIRLFVYPSLVIGNNDDGLSGIWKPTSGNISRFKDNLDSLIDNYFCSDYKTKDFEITRVTFAADMDVGSREAVNDYIKVLRNIGRVKCFSASKYKKREGVTKDNYFGLEGNTNGVEFMAFGQKGNKGILRFEVSLTAKAAIRAYCDGETNTSKLIRELAKRSKDIFMDTFCRIVPAGDYYKKEKADILIRERVVDVALRAKMLRLLELVPKKKSLYLGIKAMDDRKVKDIFGKFEEIQVSPVTISKRQNVKHLKSLYSYLTK
jgi:hypothetical protein